MCGRLDRARSRGVVGSLLVASAIGACAFRPSDTDGGAPPPTGDAAHDALVIDSPPGAPSVPQDLVAVAQDGQIVLSWKAPANAASVTGPIMYNVLATPDDTTLANGGSAGTVLGCTLGVPTALVDGASYTIQLTAMNTAGTSAPVTTTATPFPAILDSSATLLWLDANRPGSTTGGAVSTWLDLSKKSAGGSPNSAEQNTQQDQPTLGSIAGRAAVLFDGSNDYLSTGNVFDGGNTYSIFAAYVDREATVPADAVEALYATRDCGNGHPGFAGFAFNSSGQTGAQLPRIPGVESPDATSDTASTDDGSAKPQPQSGGGGPKQQIGSNTWSTLEQTIALPGGGGGENKTPLYLGAYANKCSYGDVGLGEIIVVQSAAQSDVDAVQSYLLHHWYVTRATD